MRKPPDRPATGPGTADGSPASYNLGAIGFLSLKEIKHVVDEHGK